MRNSYIFSTFVVLLILIVLASNSSSVFATDDFKFMIATAKHDMDIYPNFGKSPNLLVHFEYGEEIVAFVTATNTTNKQKTVVYWDYFKPFLPHLEKNGVVVEYQEAMKNEAGKDPNDDPIRSSASADYLQPRETKAVGFCDLNEWYGKLEPGVYELKIFYRSRGNDKPIESNIIAFEIKAEVIK